MSKKEEKQNLNEIIPWWTYGIAILSAILFGAIGAVIIFAVLYGYWYLWKKSTFTVTKKILLSFAPLILIGIIYVIAIGYFGYDYYQDINQEMESHNTEISESPEIMTLNNDKYQFSLTYPSNWKKDSVFRDNIILQLKPDDQSGSITIKEYDTEWTSHDEYLEYTTIEDLQTTFEETDQIELIKIDEDTIDGLKVFKIYYLENSPTITGSQQFEVMSIYMIRDNGKMLGINYVAYPDSFDSTIDDANTIINSIDFK